MLVPHHIDSSISLTPLYKGKKIFPCMFLSYFSLGKESTDYCSKYRHGGQHYVNKIRLH